MFPLDRIGAADCQFGAKGFGAFCGFSLALNVTLRNWINIAGSHMNDIEIVNGYHLGVISLVKGYYTMYTEVN